MHVAGRCPRKWCSGSHAAAHELSQQKERGHCIVDRVTVRPTSDAGRSYTMTSVLG